MVFLDEYNKLKNYKILDFKPLKPINRIYGVKKNDNVLIYCDKGFENRVASARLGKTFYEFFKQNGCNVSIVVGRAIKKPHLANTTINTAVLNLGKNDLFVSVASGQAIYFHENKKRLITKELMNKQGFKMIATNGLGSLENKNIKGFFNAYDFNQKEIKKIGEKLKKLFENTKNVRVTCPLGTDIVFQFDKEDKRKVINNYGNIITDTNYPVGEVYTSPLEKTASGIVFVKSSKVLGETYLHKTNQKYIIENGLFVNSSFKKLNNAMLQLEKFNTSQGLKESYSKVRNIAEFAIGTNKKAKLIGVMIVDEKVYGTCHFGIGASKHFGGKIECNGHSDHVIEKPTIYFDGKVIMKSGKFLI
jgi:leucyl aminopeptidase (aminopeptidase T)